MPNELGFDSSINSSLQVGDIVYYTEPPVNGIISEPVVAGIVTQVSHAEGVLFYEPNLLTQPSVNSFILFSKPIEVNESSLKGYYADVTLTNSSTKRAELFAVSSEAMISSK
jgi:hypothetical protein